MESYRNNGIIPSAIDEKIEGKYPATSIVMTVQKIQDALDSEVLEIIFIPGYNSFLVISGMYDLYLVSHHNFEEYRSITKLEVASKLNQPDYMYIKTKVKGAEFDRYLEDQSLKMEEVSKIYFKNKGTAKRVTSE